MKNLKKILSLVLVVAMACSMFVFASAKDYETFTDADAISEQYIEAVDVISALNIFAGDETGALNPQGTFTRAQAAKIVTYMSIGNAAAERLVASNPFSDVPASHWASKYIAYAKEAGILSGDGNGTFRPDDAVTGAEVAKLMNTVLGYGKKGEYTGASWQINAISDGVSRGLISNDGNADLTAPALREEVIQYVFNTIRSDMGNKNRMVEYNSISGSYVYASGSVEAIGGTDKSWIGTFVFRLNWNYRVNPVDGAPSHFWTQYGKDITELYPNVAANVVSTNGTAIDGLYGIVKTNGLVLPYYTVNNTPHPDFAVYINGTVKSLADAETAASKVGAQVSVWAAYNAETAKNEVYHIAVIEKTVTKVLAAPTYTYGAITSISGLPSPSFGNAYLGDTDVSKDDIVLYYTDGNGDIHINKAEAVEGQLTRYTPNALYMAAFDTATFAGTAYFISGLDGTQDNIKVGDRSAFATTSGNFNTDAVIYLDDFKNIVRLDVGTIVKNYVYAYDYSADGFNSNVAVRAKLVKADGTVLGSTLIKPATNEATIYTAGGTPSATPPQWYTYVESNGVYTLTRVAPISGVPAKGYGASDLLTGAATIEGKKTNFYTGLANIGAANIYADNSTTFIYLDSYKGKTVTYTGINAVAKANLVSGDRVSVIVSTDGGRAARYVMIDTEQVQIGAQSVAYFTSNSEYREVAGDYVHFNAKTILNGVLQEDYVKTSTPVTPGFYFVELGDDGIYSIVTTGSPVTVADIGAFNTSGGVFSDNTNGNSYGPVVFNTAAVVWDVTNAANPTPMAVADLATNTTYYSYVYGVETTNNTITHLYVVRFNATTGTVTASGNDNFGRPSFTINNGTTRYVKNGLDIQDGDVVTFWYSAGNVAEVMTANSRIDAANALITKARAGLGVAVTDAPATTNIGQVDLTVTQTALQFTTAVNTKLEAYLQDKADAAVTAPAGTVDISISTALDNTTVTGWTTDRTVIVPYTVSVAATNGTTQTFTFLLTIAVDVA